MRCIQRRGRVRCRRGYVLGQGAYRLGRDMRVGSVEDGRGVRTVRKELAEHEGVIRLGVVSWETDVLVHVEGNDMFEAGTSCHRHRRKIRRMTDDSFPSLTNLMSAL